MTITRLHVKRMRLKLAEEGFELDLIENSWYWLLLWAASEDLDLDHIY